MSWPVRVWPDPAVRRPARELTDEEFTSGRVRAMSEILLAAMTRYQGVGLAAPQVGIMVRLAVVAAPHVAPIVLANPVIVDGPPPDEWEQAGEGCLSLPGIGAPVRRPAWLELHARDLDGAPIDLDVADLEARIADHELDHLAGRTIADTTLPEARTRIRQLYRQHLVEHAHYPKPHARPTGGLAVVGAR